MRNVFLFALSTVCSQLFPTNVHAQKHLTFNNSEFDGHSVDFEYYPYYSNKKQLWGYCDEMGNNLIRPSFIRVESFYKGAAPVKGKKGWGIINSKGKWIVKPQYDTVYRNLKAFNAFKMGKQYEILVDSNLQVRIQDPLNKEIIFEEPQGESRITSAHFPTNGNTIKTLRYYDVKSERWRLGTFWIRPGKADSLMNSMENFRFKWFSESFESKDDLRFSLYRYEEDSPVRNYYGKNYGIMGWSVDDPYRSFGTDEAIFDTIQSFPRFKTTFVGKRNDNKYAILKFRYNRFYVTPVQFDEVKLESEEFNFVRMGQKWFVMNRFGEPSSGDWHYGIKTEMELHYLGENFDELIFSRSPSYLFYKKNGLYGLIHKTTNEGGYDWQVLPVQFIIIVEYSYYWFNLPYHEKYMLFEVVLSDGRKGLLNTKGIELFD